MAKNVTGKQVMAYMGNAAYFSLFLRTKKWPAQNDISIAPIEIKSDVSPTNNFLGRSAPKSFSWNLEVRMARNMITEVTEKHSATSEDMANTLKAGWFCKVGVPLLSSFTPPGTVAEVAKATVAIRAATTEHDWEVLMSHSPPCFASCSCVSLNISFGVFDSLLYLGKK